MSAAPRSLFLRPSYVLSWGARARVLSVCFTSVLACAGSPEPVAAPTPAKPAVDRAALELLRESAQAHWQERDQEAEVRAAIADWERMIAADPALPDVLVALSRAYHFLLESHVMLGADEGRAADQRTDLHRKGADYAERALLLLSPGFAEKMKDEGADFAAAVGEAPEAAVPALYWYCSNLSRFANAEGVPVKLYYKDRVSAAMLRVLELDPDYFFAGPHRYLGAFYAALPAVAGRDLEASAHHFEQARALAPQYLTNQLLEAEFLAVEREDAVRYEQLLNEVLAAPVGEDPDCAPENRAAKRRAKAMRDRMSEIFGARGA